MFDGPRCEVPVSLADMLLTGADLPVGPRAIHRRFAPAHEYAHHLFSPSHFLIRQSGEDITNWERPMF